MGIQGKRFTCDLRGQRETFEVVKVTRDRIVYLTVSQGDDWDSVECPLAEFEAAVAADLGVAIVSTREVRPRGFVVEHTDGYGGRTVASFQAASLLDAVAFADDAGLTGVDFVAVWE